MSPAFFWFYFRFVFTHTTEEQTSFFVNFRQVPEDLPILYVQSENSPSSFRRTMPRQFLALVFPRFQVYEWTSSLQQPTLKLESFNIVICNFWVCGWIPTMWLFKWKLITCTNLWCCFFSILLQNEIWCFLEFWFWFLPLSEWEGYTCSFVVMSACYKYAQLLSSVPLAFCNWHCLLFTLYELSVKVTLGPRGFFERSP